MPSQPRMPFLSFLLQTQLSRNLLQEVFPDSSQDRALQTPQYFHPLTRGVCYLWALILSLPDLQAPLAGKMIFSLCRLCNTKRDSPPSLGLSPWGHMEITSPEQGEETQDSVEDSVLSQLGYISLFWAPVSLSVHRGGWVRWLLKSFQSWLFYR